MRRHHQLGLLTAFALLAASGSGWAGLAGEIYLTSEEAPRHVFPDADSLSLEEVVLTPRRRERLADRLGGEVTLWNEVVPFYRVWKGGVLIGYAMILEEIGKTRPITFIVGITSDLKVREVAVMAYQEPRGGEVRMRRFLRQYEGKALQDPIRPFKDIVNITGATLSVRAVSRGVREALALAELLGSGEAERSMEEAGDSVHRR